MSLSVGAIAFQPFLSSQKPLSLSSAQTPEFSQQKGRPCGRPAIVMMYAFWCSETRTGLAVNSLSLRLRVVEFCQPFPDGVQRGLGAVGKMQLA